MRKRFFHWEQLGFASIDHVGSGRKAIATAALTSVNYFLITNNSLWLGWPDKHLGIKKEKMVSPCKIFAWLYKFFFFVIVILTEIVPSFFLSVLLNKFRQDSIATLNTAKPKQIR